LAFVVAPRQIAKPEVISAVHPAKSQDNHGAVPLLKYIGPIFPKLCHIFADPI